MKWSATRKRSSSRGFNGADSFASASSALSYDFQKCDLPSGSCRECGVDNGSGDRGTRVGSEGITAASEFWRAFSADRFEELIGVIGKGVWSISCDDGDRTSPISVTADSGNACAEGGRGGRSGESS